MSQENAINNLLAELGQTGSLEGALACGLRLACQWTACSAAALSGGEDLFSPAHCWMVHDPDGLLRCQETSWPSSPRPSAVETEHPQPFQGAECLAPVTISLRCAGHSAGSLVLWSSHEIDPAPITMKLSPLDSLLATLVFAMNGTVTAGGLLYPGAFRTRIGSEVIRAGRTGQGFSIVHIRLPAPYGEGKATNAWSTTLSIAEAILPQLRQSDAVGLLAPYHVGVLLSATCPLGASIAQHRIGRLLIPLTETFDGVEPEFGIVSCPDDATSVDDLCEFGGHVGHDDGRGVPVGVVR